MSGSDSKTVTFTVEVKAGNHTTPADLETMRENIRLALRAAVDDVADNVFPEYNFYFREGS